MKKVKINYKIRSIMLGVLFISMLGVLFSLVTEKQTASMNYKEETLYEYTITPHILYKVKNEPNLLSKADYINQGSNYISKFVNAIEGTLSYGFTGSEELQITGNYEVVAEARGYSIKDNQKQIIWQKNYTVVEPKKIDYFGDRLFLKENITVDFQRHNQFARQVIEEAGANIPAEFVVTMKGELEIHTEEEVIEEEIKQSLIIPLGGSYFEITEEGNEERTKKITQQVEVIEEDEVPSRMMWGGLFALMGIIYILLGTEPEKEKVSLKKQSDKIFRDYGGYLVGVEEIEKSEFVQRYKVKEIKDLIKVADELEKPILYIDGEVPICKFCVVEEKILYQYELKRESSKGNIQNINEIQSIQRL